MTDPPTATHRVSTNSQAPWKYNISTGCLASRAAAHTAAIEAKGLTVAVIGTPIGTYYPKENQALQRKIAEEHLLISQVPVLRYANQHVPQNKLFFPERNVTMSALTEGTIIVEASDTSGTLTQARAALQQGRKLFILDSCFKRDDITWPANFEKRGAVRVRDLADIWGALGDGTPTPAN
jgi:DNA processing protein